MIGHPVVRAWYARHDVPEGRARLDDIDVQRLVERLAPGSEVVDLGGEDNLNLFIVSANVVLRVHKPPVSRRRLLEEHALRSALAARDLLVPLPVTRTEQSLFRCGPRWAELEHYLPLQWAAPGSDSNRRLFDAIGHLHRGLADVTTPMTRPLTRSWTSPDTLRRWLGLNIAAGVGTLQDPTVASELVALLRLLRRRWVSADRLPAQLIHGDLHPGNVMRAATGEAVYLDLGGVTSGPRIHDLAYAIADRAFAGSAALSTGMNISVWDQIPLLIEDYEAAAGWSLEPVERSALAVYIASAALYYDICDWSEEPRRGVAAWLLENPAATDAVNQ